MGGELDYELVIQETVNNGLHAMVLAIGYKVGIVDAMDSLSKPCTAAEISKEANLNLRYVEEWLMCMSAKCIVHYENGKYIMPTSDRIRKAVHTSAVLPMFADCFPKLEAAMKNKDTNTGYPYSVMELEWFGKYSELSDINQSWIGDNIEPVIIHYQMETGTFPTHVLDFGCGYGKLGKELAGCYPQCGIYGTDIDKDAIRHCKAAYTNPNIHFAVFDDDVASLWSNKFDIIILMEVLHDLPDPVGVLSQIKSILKPNGYIVAFDPNVSSNTSENIGEKAPQNHLPYSVFFCLPNSLSKKPAVGHGGSWGIEDRKQFLTDNGYSLVHIDDKGRSVDKHHYRIVFRK